MSEMIKLNIDGKDAFREQNLETIAEQEIHNERKYDRDDHILDDVLLRTLLIRRKHEHFKRQEHQAGDGKADGLERQHERQHEQQAVDDPLVIHLLASRRLRLSHAHLVLRNRGHQKRNRQDEHDHRDDLGHELRADIHDLRLFDL